MHRLSNVASMAFLLMMALMLVAYLKEGGSLRTFGTFVFSYLKHKLLSFVSTWLMLAALMNILYVLVLGATWG